MFQIKQPDQFALTTAERINATGSDIKNFMVSAVTAGFRELFYDGEAVRPVADIRRILSAFERPAELFQRHAATVQYLLSQYPDCMAPEDYTPPVKYTISADGTVTLED